MGLCNSRRDAQNSQNPSILPNNNQSTIINIGQYPEKNNNNDHSNSQNLNNSCNYYPNNIPNLNIDHTPQNKKEENNKLEADSQLSKSLNHNEKEKLKGEINELKKLLKSKEIIIMQKDNDIKELRKAFIKSEQEKINLKNKENENFTNFNNILMKKKAKYNNKISELQSEIEKYKNKKKNKLEELKRVNSLQIMEKELPILVGLNNIGATCYMNATLQCLSNTTKLREYFLKMFKYEVNNKNRIISNEYYNVVKNLWDINNTNRSFSPYSFKEKLSQENPLFKGIQANDSKDLINFLLERIHLELNEPTEDQNNNMMKNYEITQSVQLNEGLMLKIFINEFKMKYNSVISHLFYGMIETKSKCMKCQNIKYNFQVYSFLEFPLEQVNKYCFNQGKRQNYILNNKNPDIDLYECFEYHCNLELMTGDNQMYCNICNSNEDALYGTQIYSAPHYLIINLNRGRGAVYECKVNFPEKINLLNFITFKNENTFFELYAVISHLGPSSMSGHFVAYCKRRKDENFKWYLFNDAIVSECKNKEEYRNGMPYILFYKAV